MLLSTFGVFRLSLCAIAEFFLAKALTGRNHY